MARAPRENLLALGPGPDGHRVSDLETASYLFPEDLLCAHEDHELGRDTDIGELKASWEDHKVGIERVIILFPFHRWGN